MSRRSLFHICPKELTGSVLYPLSELELEIPALAARAKQKYCGREWLPYATVPHLNCRWMDVVMFVPVHPMEIKDGLLAAGHHRYPDRWIDIDAAELAQERMAILLPGESPNQNEFVPFDVERLADHARLSAAQRAAYGQGPAGKVLLFGHTAHVLHHGRVALDRARFLSV